ncbi:MAG TPA: hypothetical protein VIJ20_03230, partial [Solirubrobacteraceae bacterium]
VRVSAVAAGNEEKLRHYLESVVEQANAAVRPAESDAGEGAQGESDRYPADARMTASFRAFADDAGADAPAAGSQQT